MKKIEIYYDGELYARFNAEEHPEEYIAIGLIASLFRVSTKQREGGEE